MQKFISTKGATPKAGPGFRPPVVQAKLTVNQPGDRYEREADAVADRVMQTPSGPQPFRPVQGLIASSLQRKCAACEQEEKRRNNRPLMRKAERGGGFEASASLVSKLGSGGGSPLPGTTRGFMESAFSADFSRVRIHADGEAAGMSREIQAKAFTYGHHIYFDQGQYNPQSPAGKRLLAHELTHTLQQNGSTHAHISQQPAADGRATIRREPWFRGEATGVAPAPPGSVIHDLGDGLYLTDSPEVAAQYAATRAASLEGSAEVLLTVNIERSTLGRVLDLTTDPHWQQFLAEPAIPNGPTHEALIRSANENYGRIFQEFLRRRGINLAEFDAVIGPEFVRGGNQLCVRNPGIIARIRATFRPYVPAAGGAGAASQTASASGSPEVVPTQVRVGTRFNILNVITEAGNTIAEVEVVLAEGAEELNRIARGPRQMPGRFVLRITTNAEGVLVSAQSVGAELGAGATEALARQVVATLPQAAGAAEGAAAAASAARTARWVRGIGWAGSILFVGLTAYQYSVARTDRERGRVLVTAGAGFAGGALSSYLVCNVLLGIETLGWSLLGCLFVAGGVGGYASAEAAGGAYDEATATPLEGAIHSVREQPEQVQRLFFGMIDPNGNIGGVPLSAEFVREFLATVPADLNGYEAAVLLGMLRATGRQDSLQSVLDSLRTAIWQLAGRRPIRLPDRLNIMDIMGSPRGGTRYRLDMLEGGTFGPVRLLPPERELPGGTDFTPADRRPAYTRPLVEITL